MCHFVGQLISQSADHLCLFVYLFVLLQSCFAFMYPLSHHSGGHSIEEIVHCVQNMHKVLYTYTLVLWCSGLVEITEFIL